MVETFGERSNQKISGGISDCASRPDGCLPSVMALELAGIQEKLEKFRSSILRDVDKRMSIMIDEIMQDIQQNEMRNKEFKNFSKTSNQVEKNQKTWNNRFARSCTNAVIETEDKQDSSPQMRASTDQSVKKTLPDKVFVTRESYLTVLLEIPHMKSIYHIFYIILLVFLLNSICYDYFVEGRVNFGLGTFKSGFENIFSVLGVLILKNLFAISIYYGFKIWAVSRKSILVSLLPEIFQKILNYACLSAYIASQIFFFYVASILCLRWDLPFITANVLLLENTRLLMKMHSFIRVNCARQLQGKLKTDDDGKGEAKLAVPALSSYVYFLFAPTLIYRDSYPRTNQIRWKFALNRLLEVIAIAFLYSYIYERHILVHFGNYGLESLTASSIIVNIFGMIMPSVVILLCGFYLVLHAWLNFTSELLRFGDRMFYKDWWTSPNYDAYFRNWNVVVHDWLYEYIYKDLYNSVFKGSKVACSMMVFMISALVHEHILGFALQVFFPVMFAFFGIFGVGFVFLTRKLPKTLGNIFLWFSLIFGYNLMVSLYCMEYFAAKNCPKTYNSWSDYITPAIWQCYSS